MRDGERSRWTRVAARPDLPLDLLDARFVHHRFAPHAHEEFSIGVCSEGVEVLDYRGTKWHASPGTVVILEPGEPHTGYSAIPEGFAYRAMYPAASLVAESGLADPHFPVPIVVDPQLAVALRAAHVALATGTDRLEAETRLTSGLAALLARHAEPGPRRTGRQAGHRVARATMARLADELLAPPSLADIATEFGLSRFQLLRAFHTEVGMPPYAWLAQYRVNRARGLLADGHRPAEAAALVGFADQAHLTRWFRRVVGVTPGSFRNSVQDSVRRIG